MMLTSTYIFNVKIINLESFSHHSLFVKKLFVIRKKKLFNF